MSLSTMDHVQISTTRPERNHAPRRRLRNARRALVLVTSAGVVAPRHDHGVRLHPVELGPWDD